MKLLQTMRKKEFRKHLRSLKTAKAKEEAKAERAKQVAKKAACKEAVEKVYAEGGSPRSQRANFAVDNRQSACWWEAKEGHHTSRGFGKVRHAQAR